MQTAYLIMAHHQPNHLARLVRILDGTACAFFIHIDGKVDDKIFKESLGMRRNVVFSGCRRRVNWGGFSQVDATLALLSEALNSDASFHRFCLLSGADFPIKRSSQILAEFDSSKEFMRVDRKLDSIENSEHGRYVSAYWFMDSSHQSLRELSGRLRRRTYKHLSLYQGCNWWALTRDCVEYVMRFLSSNRSYRSFFKYARCSDEIFFHSIVKQSPFASQITQDFQTTSDRARYYPTNEHACHYIDWRPKTGKAPKILDLEDFDKLLSSRSLFARKFDEQKSDQLIARLESMLAG